MFKRSIEKELLSLANQYPVVTVTGPRQSGKTTLVKSLFAKKKYVSLENPDERLFATSDPRAFLDRFPDGAILDEIQRVPELLSYIQGIVDEKLQKAMFILTGSHQLALHESISQSLAGRTAILKLMPLSMRELNKDFTLNDYIFTGMYPAIYKDNLNPTKFYSNYTQTYIERDVRMLVNVKDLSIFQSFIKLCAGRIGQVLNNNSLSNELGVSVNTIKQWLSILEASFLIYRLQPYYENFGKRMIKSPKLYFTDTGLATYLLDINDKKQLERDPLRGNLVENFIITECLKNRFNKSMQPNFYFYRDNNLNEVDLLIKNGNQLTPVEIKSAKTFNSKFIKNLEYFKKISKEKYSPGFLIYDGEQEQKIDSLSVLNFKNLSKVFGS